MAKNQEIFRTKSGRIEASGEVTTSQIESQGTFFTLNMGTEGSVIKGILINLQFKLENSGAGGSQGINSLQFFIDIIKSVSGTDTTITSIPISDVYDGNPPNSIGVIKETNVEVLNDYLKSEYINLESDISIKFKFNYTGSFDTSFYNAIIENAPVSVVVEDY